MLTGSLELHALGLHHRTYRPGGVLFQLPAFGKKRVVGAPPKLVMFGAFPDDEWLCVINCLRQYEAVTAQHRKKQPSEPQPLFLLCIQPHAPVTSQCLSHWLKRDAGVDTTVFKAHSVRGASSTAASEKWVLMEGILHTANWSTDSTFRGFITSLLMIIVMHKQFSSQDQWRVCLKVVTGLCTLEVYLVFVPLSAGLCYRLILVIVPSSGIIPANCCG